MIGRSPDVTHRAEVPQQLGEGPREPGRQPRAGTAMLGAGSVFLVFLSPGAAGHRAVHAPRSQRTQHTCRGEARR